VEVEGKTAKKKRLPAWSRLGGERIKQRKAEKERLQAKRKKGNPGTCVHERIEHPEKDCGISKVRREGGKIGVEKTRPEGRGPRSPGLKRGGAEPAKVQVRGKVQRAVSARLPRLSAGKLEKSQRGGSVINIRKVQDVEQQKKRGYSPKT